MADRSAYGVAGVITLFGLGLMVTGVLVRLGAPDTGAAIAIGGAVVTLCGRVLRIVARKQA